MVEAYNRQLNIGDLVITDFTDGRLHYAIVLDANNGYTGGEKTSIPLKTVYRIEQLSQAEIEIKKRMTEKYNSLMSRKSIKAYVRGNIKTGGIYECEGQRIYKICLGTAAGLLTSDWETTKTGRLYLAIRKVDLAKLKDFGGSLNRARYMASYEIAQNYLQQLSNEIVTVDIPSLVNAKVPFQTDDDYGIWRNPEPIYFTTSMAKISGEITFDAEIIGNEAGNRYILQHPEATSTPNFEIEFKKTRK